MFATTAPFGATMQPAGENASAPKMGFMSMVTQGYGELVNAIIRPPRAEYEVADLGARKLYAECF